MTELGWRRNPSSAQADEAIIAALRGIPVALISDNMARLGGSFGLLAYHKPRPLAGTAVTVKTRAGDNLAIHSAFDFCRPGDVLVIDGGGDVSQALLGDIMASYAQSIGIVGLVIDGAIRDVAEIRSRDFPCYARGVTHRGPYKNGPGEINVPVTVGGMTVLPGDIVVGDEDGLLCFPQSDAPRLVELARAQEQQEAKALQAIRDRNWDRSWVAVQEKKAKG